MPEKDCVYSLSLLRALVLPYGVPAQTQKKCHEALFNLSLISFKREGIIRHYYTFLYSLLPSLIYLHQQCNNSGRIRVLVLLEIPQEK
jgi:hypothetical protein